MDSIGSKVTSNEKSINTNKNGKCLITLMSKSMIWENFGTFTSQVGNRQTSYWVVWQDKPRQDKKSLTTPKLNKAVYTAALVADGWAGAGNLKKPLCYGPSDQPTDQQTKKWLIELRVRD